jgi:cytoskeletal protein RodZ
MHSILSRFLTFAKITGRKLLKHKMTIVAVAVILSVLAAAWNFGESSAPTEHMAPDAELTAREPETRIKTQFDEPGSAFIEVHQTQTSEVTPNPTPDSTEAPVDDTPSSAPDSTEAQTTPDPAAGSTEAPTTPSSAPAHTSAPTVEETFSVTLSVRADTLLDNMHLLDSDKHELVPASGVLFSRSVTVSEGDSVFDILQREMRRAGIHMASRFTPVYDSVYIVAIHNIAEFDAGPLSGWLYRVNGQFLGFSASQQFVSSGDVIEWIYSTDLGRDIGGGIG